jgi:hypothetical protein
MIGSIATLMHPFGFEVVNDACSADRAFAVVTGEGVSFAGDENPKDVLRVASMGHYLNVFSVVLSPDDFTSERNGNFLHITCMVVRSLHHSDQVSM